MGIPAQFTNGVNIANVGEALYHFGMPDPTKWHVFFDDFDRYVVGDWTITTTEAGAGSATEALADANGGVLLITNDAADNDADFFQKVGESFLFSSTKKMFFKARFKVSDATQSDVVIGLQVTDTTPLAVSDGIYFQKDDGDTNIDFNVTGSSTDTASSAVGTLADNTYVTVAFAYLPTDPSRPSDGAKFLVFIDDVLKASVATTNAPATELTVSFGIQNGEAVAKTMSLDYIFAALER